MGIKDFENTGAASKQEAVFSASDLDGKNHEEQMQHFDDALAKLELMSGGVQNALGNTELERVGQRGIAEQSSLFDKAKLGIHELLNNSDGYDARIVKSARKLADKNLGRLEKGLGSEIIEMKEKISKHDKTTKHDLDIFKNLPGMSPETIKLMESKVAEETAALEQEKSLKENELKSHIDEYPATKKNEQLDSLLGEYGRMEATVTTKRMDLEKNIRTYELNYKKIEGKDESSKEMKKLIEDGLKTLKEQCKEMKKKEAAVKERVKVLKADKKELEPFIKRLNSVGKTKIEIFGEKKTTGGQENKDSQADNKNKKQATNPNKAKTASQSNQSSNQQSPQAFIAPDANGGNPSQTADQEDIASVEDVATKLANMVKSPREWASEINKIAPNLIGKGIVSNFGRNIKKSQLNGLEVITFLSKFLIDKKTIVNSRKALDKANEIISRLAE